MSRPDLLSPLTMVYGHGRTQCDCADGVMGCHRRVFLSQTCEPKPLKEPDGGFGYLYWDLFVSRANIRCGEQHGGVVVGNIISGKSVLGFGCFTGFSVVGKFTVCSGWSHRMSDKAFVQRYRLHAGSTCFRLVDLNGVKVCIRSFPTQDGNWMPSYGWKNMGWVEHGPIFTYRGMYWCMHRSIVFNFWVA